MFYEEKTIQNILNCEICAFRLDVPKKLACGSTICSICESALKVSNNQFECSLCSETHQINLSKGLPICRIISNILSIKPNEIARGNAVESLKSNLNDIKQKIVKLNSSVNNGAELIKQHCFNLRTQIQNTTDHCFEKINDLNKQLINEIDIYESDCYDSYETNQHNQHDFINTVDELVEFNKQWSDYIKKLEISEETVLEANSSAIELIHKADEQNYRLEEFIFNGNYLKFERNNNSLNSILGRLESRDKLKSVIITNEQMKELMKMCKFPLSQEWNLVFRATRDGFAAADFHSKCDDVNNNLTIIKSTNGNVFGGYTEQNWSGKCYKNDPNAFIYSLINKEKKPLVSKCLSDQSAICCSTTCGVIFGNSSSCDILICDNSNKAKESGSNLGSSYPHPNYEFDSEEANAFLAGSMYFQTLEIEVYQKV